MCLCNNSSHKHLGGTEMKKITKILLMMMLVGAFLVGCGNTENDTMASGGDIQQVVNGQEGASEDENVSDESAVDDADIAIKGQELFSFNGLTIKAKDVPYDKLLLEGIEVVIENNSTEKYTIKCETAVINGYTYGAIFREEVEQGETLESYVSLWGMEEFFGAEDIANVALYFEVRDSAYSVVYNSGEVLLETTKANEINIMKPEGGNVIYEGDGIRITSLGLWLNDSHEWHFRVLVENNTDEFINVDCDKALVNGNEIETLYYQDVCPNKMALSDFTFYSAMSSYELEDIEDIIISFKITNVDTYDLIDNTDIISVPLVMAE